MVDYVEAYTLGDDLLTKSISEALRRIRQELPYSKGYSFIAKNFSETIYRLNRGDLTLKWIDPICNPYTDLELSKLVDCLLTNSNAVTAIWLCYSELTDEMGVKLARYVATSTTIETLVLNGNYFGRATYTAMAWALSINTSLRVLYLFNNQSMDKGQFDPLFVDALRLTPDRPIDSEWWLFSSSTNDYQRLKEKANQLGHPTMQSSLATGLC